MIYEIKTIQWLKGGERNVERNLKKDGNLLEKLARGGEKNVEKVFQPNGEG